VIVMIADDLGENDLVCYGNEAGRTPNIDRLASEGMRFTRAFLTISSCSPSRCSILTGRYPHNTGAEDLHMPLPEDQWTIARYLKTVGYFCASVGKWHLGQAERAHWHRIAECQGEDMAERTKTVLAERTDGQPFFLWLASMDPHRPYQDETIKHPHDPAHVRVPPYLPDHPLIRRELAQYYDEISRFDGQIGIIRAHLESMGELDRTLIFFLSDNGMPFPRAKTTLYDSGIGTPLIARWPGQVAAGMVPSGLVSSLDLAPTILEVAGVAQDTMQGRSFLPILRDPRAKGRSMIFAEANWHDFEKFTRAARTDRYKLIRNYYWDTPLWNSVDSINSITWQGLLASKRAGNLTPAQAFLFLPERPYEEFYDLAADPFEMTNLVEAAGVRAELNHLRIALDNWRVVTRDTMPEERTRDGWTRDGDPLPHNQPWYDRFIEQGGTNRFDKF
jgi:arylsulfatase A-like enzyme